MYQIRDGEWNLEMANVCAHALSDGNYIFYWDSKNGDRKLILTHNNGSQIRSGYLPLPASDWNNINTWNSGVQYKLMNFYKKPGKNSLSQ